MPHERWRLALGVQQEVQGFGVLGEVRERPSDVDHVRDPPLDGQVFCAHLLPVLSNPSDISEVKASGEPVQLDVCGPEPGLPVVRVHPELLGSTSCPSEKFRRGRPVLMAGRSYCSSQVEHPEEAQRFRITVSHPRSQPARGCLTETKSIVVPPDCQ